MSTAPFISESDAQLELGLSGAKWREFLQRSGLTVYHLHGGAHVLKRGALYTHVSQAIEQGGVPETTLHVAPRPADAKDAA